MRLLKGRMLQGTRGKERVCDKERVGLKRGSFEFWAGEGLYAVGGE